MIPLPWLISLGERSHCLAPRSVRALDESDRLTVGEGHPPGSAQGADDLVDGPANDEQERDREQERTEDESDEIVHACGFSSFLSERIS